MIRTKHSTDLADFFLGKQNVQMSLEEAIGYVASDELIEVSLLLMVPFQSCVDLSCLLSVNELIIPTGNAKSREIEKKISRCQ